MTTYFRSISFIFFFFSFEDEWHLMSLTFTNQQFIFLYYLYAPCCRHQTTFELHKDFSC